MDRRKNQPAHTPPHAVMGHEGQQLGGVGGGHRNDRRSAPCFLKFGASEAEIAPVGLVWAQYDWLPAAGLLGWR